VANGRHSSAVKATSVRRTDEFDPYGRMGQRPSPRLEPSPDFQRPKQDGREFTLDVRNRYSRSQLSNSSETGARPARTPFPWCVDADASARRMAEYGASYVKQRQGSARRRSTSQDLYSQEDPPSPLQNYIDRDEATHGCRNTPSY
jgi:hypothetical protein